MLWPVFLVAFGLNAAEPLSVINPVVAQSDGGTPLPAGFEHAPGEVLFFSFEVQGFQAAGDKVRLKYRIDAFDPKGVRIMETVQGPIAVELAPQDKNWKPKVRREITIPPLAPSGTYKIAVVVEDEVAGKSASRDVEFTVRGHQVDASDTLVIRNFHFYRSENATEPLAKAAYRAGDAVWARFDITGQKFGPGNRIEVSYGIAVLNAEGKVLWSQPEAAVDRDQSFYPKPYVPGSMSLQLQPNIRPGQYAVAITAKDAVGDQTYETKQTFIVE